MHEEPVRNWKCEKEQRVGKCVQAPGYHYQRTAWPVCFGCKKKTITSPRLWYIFHTLKNNHFLETLKWIIFLFISTWLFLKKAVIVALEFLFLLVELENWPGNGLIHCSDLHKTSREERWSCEKPRKLAVLKDNWMRGASPLRPF